MFPRNRAFPRPDGFARAYVDILKKTGKWICFGRTGDSFQDEEVTMRFIQLHTDKGRKLYVNVEGILAVQECIDAGPNVGCKMYDAGGETYIKEDYKRVIDLIDSAFVN